MIYKTIWAMTLACALCAAASADNADIPDHSTLSSPLPSLQRTSLLHAQVEVNMLDAQNQLLPIAIQKGYAHIDASQSVKLKLRNTGIDRALILISINGINPLDGRPTLRRSKGFILKGGQTLVIDKGMASKKSSASNLMDQHPPQGFVNLSIYNERFDFPLLTPDIGVLPFGPENFVTDAQGVRHWIPPQGFGFRRQSFDPNAQVHITYDQGNGFASGNRSFSFTP